jgi:rubrerythrin
MLFFSLALISALTLWYILLPLWRPAPVPTATQASSAETLPERRDNLLRQLKELEFDQSMGKLDANDYQQMRADLTSETSAVLAELENAKGHGPISHASTRNLDLELEVEVQIARARRRLSASGRDLWRCTECGRQMAGSDRFCASCGARRNDEQPSDERLNDGRFSDETHSDNRQSDERASSL